MVAISVFGVCLSIGLSGASEGHFFLGNAPWVAGVLGPLELVIGVLLGGLLGFVLGKAKWKSMKPIVGSGTALLVALVVVFSSS